MPQLGEMKKAKELGYKGAHRYIWYACKGCGKERWVICKKGQPIYLKCRSCTFTGRTGNQCSSWKGGRYIDSVGYIHIWLSKDDFFSPMANKQGYVMEHRLVVAKALNRCLLSWEVVHHKGAKYPLGSKENRSNNRYPENLELIKGHGRHNKEIERELNILQQRVTLLEAENILLKRQLENTFDNINRIPPEI